MDVVEYAGWGLGSRLEHLHVEDGQAHRDEDAGQYAEKATPSSAITDSLELHSSLPPQSTRSGDIGQGQRCGDHDGTQCGLWHVLHCRGGEDQHQGDHGRADDTVTWDREPACSATAVRDPLVLTGKPWKKPAAMFAAPMPIISWLPRTCSPRRAANADAVDMVSASATTAMANAPRRAAAHRSTRPWGS